MCILRKVASVEVPEEPEVIQDAVKADASTEKASAETRLQKRNFVSENIKTSNLGVDEDVVTSKKKLLGE